MKILWFTWKDKKNPESGGAEVVNEELAKRLVEHGHEVIFIVRGFEWGAPEEIVDGYKVIRVGNRFTVYWEAYKYYKYYLQEWPDYVIEEINTIPFFTHLYIKRTKIVYIFYQLARQVWFHQMSFPLSLLGYFMEPVYLWFMSFNNFTVLTESESARTDLSKYGFKKERTKVFPIGIEIEPLINLEAPKYEIPTMLSLGAMRGMKRPDQQIKAFELAKEHIPNLQMKIGGTGEGEYFERVIDMIKKSPYANDIEYLGRVSIDKKIELMQKSHIITVTSIKEGWGLIVTEANSQGTPAVVYDIDGLRDSVQDGRTGLITEQNSPEALSEKIIEIFGDTEKYEWLRRNAWHDSKQFTFDGCYDRFSEYLFNA